MPSARARNILSLALATTILFGLIACAPERNPTATESPSPTVSALPAPVEKEKSFFDKGRYSIDDPTSIWVINDKIRPLNPLNYVPQGMVTPNVRYISSPLIRAEAGKAIEKLFAASAAEGAGELQIQNAYRSFDLQTTIHNRLIAQLGKAKAQAQSARPGHSEHQTGLTADVVGWPAVCSIQTCFGTTPQGKWLAANAWRYGFVIRYPEGKTDVTGYIYEPWHIRYVGTLLSTEMHNTGVETLEEFFDLPPAPDYTS